MYSDACDLFRIIPEDIIRERFQKSNTMGAELDFTFLGFEEIYQLVNKYVPKDKIIIDLGCAYAFQAWYFRDNPKYIGVDNGVTINDTFDTGNAEYYLESIQDFLNNTMQALNIDKNDCFAICSYVPNSDARAIVAEAFPNNSLVYYPGQMGHFNVWDTELPEKDAVESGHYHASSVEQAWKTEADQERE